MERVCTLWIGIDKIISDFLLADCALEQSLSPQKIITIVKEKLKLLDKLWVEKLAQKMLLK